MHLDHIGLADVIPTVQTGTDSSIRTSVSCSMMAAAFICTTAPVLCVVCLFFSCACLRSRILICMSDKAKWHEFVITTGLAVFFGTNQHRPRTRPFPDDDPPSPRPYAPADADASPPL